MRAACVLGCLNAAALAACSGASDTPSSTASSDAGDAAPVPDAGVDVSATVVTDAEAGAVPPADAIEEAPANADSIGDAHLDAGTLACPGDLSTAGYVAATTVMGAAPAFTGVTIPDGTYIMTAAIQYVVGAASCSTAPSGDAAPRMDRGAITVSAGIVRLDLQTQGNAEECATGALEPSISSDAGDIIVFHGSDGGPGLGFLYTVSSDGHTVYAAFAGSGCNDIGSDASSSSSRTVGSFVRP
jgi:hypothetical protein